MVFDLSSVAGEKDAPLDCSAIAIWRKLGVFMTGLESVVASNGIDHLCQRYPTALRKQSCRAASTRCARSAASSSWQYARRSTSTRALDLACRIIRHRMGMTQPPSRDDPALYSRSLDETVKVWKASLQLMPLFLFSGDVDGVLCASDVTIMNPIFQLAMERVRWFSNHCVSIRS
jgi:hypothetical protein